LAARPSNHQQHKVDVPWQAFVIQAKESGFLLDNAASGRTVSNGNGDISLTTSESATFLSASVENGYIYMWHKAFIGSSTAIQNLNGQRFYNRRQILSLYSQAVELFGASNIPSIEYEGITRKNFRTPNSIVVLILNERRAYDPSFAIIEYSIGRLANVISPLVVNLKNGKYGISFSDWIKKAPIQQFRRETIYAAYPELTPGSSLKPVTDYISSVSGNLSIDYHALNWRFLVQSICLLLLKEELGDEATYSFIPDKGVEVYQVATMPDGGQYLISPDCRIYYSIKGRNDYATIVETNTGVKKPKL
jgi:hypothetical protein